MYHSGTIEILFHAMFEHNYVVGVSFVRLQQVNWLTSLPGCLLIMASQIVWEMESLEEVTLFS